MYNILFVCLGNICRSPAAEGVMDTLISRQNPSPQIQVDSAGTAGYHAGEKADRRMRQAASARGIELTSISRQFRGREDFEKFDLIVAMDDENLRDILRLDPPGRYRDKVVKMTDFCRRYNDKYVPDPYYGGPNGFEYVLDLLEDACTGLMEHLKNAKL